MKMSKQIQTIWNDYGAPYQSIKIQNDNEVIGRLVDHFEVSSSFPVHTKVEGDVNCLSIIVSEITNIRDNPDLSPLLLMMNHQLILGTVGVDLDGWVDFQMQFPIEADFNGIWEVDERTMEVLFEMTAKAVTAIRLRDLYLTEADHKNIVDGLKRAIA